MFDMKRHLRWAKLKVGLVITLSLLVLLIAVFFAGGIEKIFSPKIDLKIQFQDVRGLRKGAPIWIFGTEVGSVKNIHLDPSLGPIVTISVHKDVQEYIKKDAQASILTMGLLGDMYVELSAGSPQAETIRRGEMIKGTVPLQFSDIMETAAASIGKVGDFIKKLDSLLERIEKGEGTLAKFLIDPSIYDNLNKTIQTLSLTLEEIRDSKGTLKMLVEDPSLYQKIVSAVSSIEEFAKKTNESVGEITRKINEGQGTLKKLVEDPSLYDKTLRVVLAMEEFSNKLNTTVSSIEEFSRKINESPGTLKKIIEDPSLYDKTFATISSIEQFSKKLNEETGTLKRLVEDPQLYENLNRTIIQLSAVLKRMDEGEGLAGAVLNDKEMVKELKETIIEFKKTAGELKELMKDIKEKPKKYFKFSIF